MVAAGSGQSRRDACVLAVTGVVLVLCGREKEAALSLYIVLDFLGAPEAVLSGTGPARYIRELEGRANLLTVVGIEGSSITIQT